MLIKINKKNPVTNLWIYRNTSVANTFLDKEPYFEGYIKKYQTLAILTELCS